MNSKSDVGPNSAMAPSASAPAAGLDRFRLGDFEIVVVSDGTRSYRIEASFIRNATVDEINAALNAGGLTPGTMTVEFNALAVKVGAGWTLIDTGNGAHRFETTGRMPANLAAAGIGPEDVETILISHFHPDHINGLRTAAGAPAYPKAQVKVPAREWAFWMENDGGRSSERELRGHFENAERVLRGLEDQITSFEWDSEVVPGIRALASVGHTPGHTSFMISSGPERLFVLGDAINQPALYVTHPDWQSKADVEGETAVRTRWELLQWLAAERTLFVGFHFPFPSVGHIQESGNGYRYAPLKGIA